MKKSTLLLVSIILLLSNGCSTTSDVVYVEREFPRVPEYIVKKQTFEPLNIEYEVIRN